VTYKVERFAGGEHRVVLRVSGRIQAKDVNAIKKSIEQETVGVSLDLTEVMLADRDVVTLLAAYELKGIEISKCPRFLREWIDKEKVQMGPKP
jgi:hypothetical protein